MSSKHELYKWGGSERFKSFSGRFKMSGLLNTFGKSKCEVTLAKVADHHGDMYLVSKYVQMFRFEIESLGKSNLNYSIRDKCIRLIKEYWINRIENSKINAECKTYLRNLLCTTISIEKKNRIGISAPIA